MGWFYFLVGFLGAAVAIGELISRYRDAPMRALATIPASLYILVNALASIGALAIIRAFDWKFGVSGSASDASVRWTQTLIAGFGALTFFRSSLFIAHVGDQDIGMGPSAFLQSVLDAADRGVDRERANARSRLVGRVMKGISFQKAHQSLPAYSLGLMQNVPADTQAQLGKQVEALRTATMPDSAKVLLLGLLLMNLLGGGVLDSAVTALREEIAEPGAPETKKPAKGIGSRSPRRRGVGSATAAVTKEASAGETKTTAGDGSPSPGEGPTPPDGVTKPGPPPIGEAPRDQDG